ncbi:MAG: XrtA/PEP-CTERM system histidine kinase PrsK [Gammaproteobacteria bacterium]
MIGYYSYLSAAAGFVFLTVLLLFSWRSSVQGRLLTIVTAVTAIWAGVAAGVTQEDLYLQQDSLYQFMEVLRYLAWYIFLLKLLEPAARNNSGYRGYLGWALPLSSGFVMLVLLAGQLMHYLPGFEGMQQLLVLNLAAHVLLAIIGLLIVEQLFRNASARHRWAIKYLFIGAGGIFAYDFYMYANALLFRDMDTDLWNARGIVTLLAVPLLTLSAARNRDWSHNLFVSRDIVLHATTVMGAGLYLLVMAAAGYYLREFGGSWGRIVQVSFLALAVFLLVAVLFSGQFRSQLRVFLGKHFYKNKYDYRHEWLQLTGELNKKNAGEDEFESVVRVIARIVDARAGLLWLRDEHSRFKNVAAWQTTGIDVVIAADDALIRFLEDKAYVINLQELEACAGEYEGLDVPDCLSSIDRCWLIVPLVSMNALAGFIVLANPMVMREVNWEDRDLLKTAAMQISSYLTVLMTTDALAEARQFEAFNRISSYMVHDLKNIAAELELVARNAVKHKTNPEFIDDAFATIDDTAASIKRLLEQLRNRHVKAEKQVTIDLAMLVNTVLGKQADVLPRPQLRQSVSCCRVIAAKDRLQHVLIHLIDNARQATGQNGSITISLSVEAGDAPMCVVAIADDGQGMDADFIRNRLFKPFDTTRGNAGMGIGMYESREFIRQLQGDIRVQSEPGKGTVVSLYIPACE